MAGTNRLNDRNEMPSGVRKIFGKPPIMAGENPADYEQLMDLVREDVDPQDLQEWLLMRDIVDAAWELLRLRGLKVGMLHAMIPRAVDSQIYDAAGLRPAGSTLAPAIRKHLVGIVAGDEGAKRDLEKLFEQHGLTLDVIAAAAFEKAIVQQLHTDRMVGAAQDRRKAAYAELERLRAQKAKRAMPQSEYLDEGEADAAPTSPGNGGPARHEHVSIKDDLAGRSS
jgi:hypothetical protein